LNHAKRYLNHAKCSLNHAKRYLNHAKRSLNHAKCSLNHAKQWPDQWPATTDEWAEPVEGDDEEMAIIRPLLKQTMVRSLYEYLFVAYMPQLSLGVDLAEAVPSNPVPYIPFVKSFWWSYTF
jgi:hypothetical protein